MSDWLKVKGDVATQVTQPSTFRNELVFFGKSKQLGLQPGPLCYGVKVLLSSRFDPFMRLSNEGLCRSRSF